MASARRSTRLRACRIRRSPRPQPSLHPHRPPDDRAAHNGIFAALGRFTYRNRRWLPIAGLALVIGLNVWAATAGGDLSQGGWQIEGSEAAQAEALVADRFGEQATSLIVILTDPDGDAASEAFQATVAETVAPLADEPVVSEILTYADVGDPSFLSRDGTKTFALIRLDEEVEAAVDDAEHLAALVDAPAGVETTVTGIPLVQHEFNAAIEEDLFRAEVISLPIAMLILLAVFGTLVGAVLPVIIAGMALPSAMAVISLLAGVTEMSIFVTNVATMIGLALSIDYSLFTVSRFREELRHRTVADAVERTMATVGKAVAVSGIAVAIGLGSLVVFESAALRSMGIGGVATVLSTLIFGLTVLPAILGMLGHRVNRLRVPLPSALRLVEDDPALADARQGHGYWGRVARVVMRHPVAIATPFLIVLILAAIPFFSIQLSTGGNLDDLPDSPSVTGFHILEDEFPGGGSDPIEAAVRYEEPIAPDGALPPEWVAGLEAYEADLAEVEHVTEITSVLDPPAGMDEAVYRQLISVPEAQRPPEAAGLAAWIDQWVADDVTRLDIFSSALPDSSEGRAVVDEVRATPGPEGSEEVLTGGLSSRSHDFMASFTESVPWAIAIVVGVTAIVLFLTFGSVFLPIKAVLMSLLSITASFGALDLDLPGGQPVRAARFRGIGDDRGLHADPDVRDPLRAVDGLRGAAPLSDPRAIPRDRRQHAGRGGGDRRDRRDHHRSGPDHGRRVRRLRAVIGDGHQVPRLRDGPRGPHRRDDRARDPRPGVHAGDGQPELVGAAMDAARRRPPRPVRGLPGAGRRGASRGLIGSARLPAWSANASTS